MSMSSSGAPHFDAIVLAGGRAKRLGGVDKAALELESRPLLHHILDQLGDAWRIAIVGPKNLSTLIGSSPIAGRVILTQEEPAFGGPAAGIGAGMMALVSTAAPEFVAILTVDAPWSPAAIPTLFTAIALAESEPVPGPESRPAPNPSSEHSTELIPDLAVAIDTGGRVQWLTSVARRSALIDRITSHGPLTNASARQLLAPLQRVEVPLSGQHPSTITQDIDTPEDAARHSIAFPPSLSAQTCQGGFGKSTSKVKSGPPENPNPVHPRSEHE